MYGVSELRKIRSAAEDRSADHFKGQDQTKRNNLGGDERFRDVGWIWYIYHMRISREIRMTSRTPEP
jgi:hypothetical protein